MRYLIGITLALLVAIPTGSFIKQSFIEAAKNIREANMN